MKETDVQRRLQKAASSMGAWLWRQNVALAWVGSKVEKVTKTRTAIVRPGDIILRAGRPLKVGHEGMSDLGGFRLVEITSDMVGTKIAQYLQAEVKAGARTSEEQQKWIDFVNDTGGRAGVVRNEADLAGLLGIDEA